MLFEMLVGKTPFYHKIRMKTFKRILKPFYKPDLVEQDDHAKDLIKRILVENPLDRIGYQAEGLMAIKNHPFFSSIDWDKLHRKEQTPPFVPQADIQEHDLSAKLQEELDPSEIKAASLVDGALFSEFSEHEFSESFRSMNFTNHSSDSDEDDIQNNICLPN